MQWRTQGRAANLLTRVTSTRKAIGSRHKMKSAAMCQGPFTGLGSTTAGGIARTVPTSNSAIVLVMSPASPSYTVALQPRASTSGLCTPPLPKFPRWFTAFSCSSDLFCFSSCFPELHTPRSQSAGRGCAAREKEVAGCTAAVRVPSNGHAGLCTSGLPPVSTGPTCTGLRNPNSQPNKKHAVFPSLKVVVEAGLPLETHA